MADRPEDPLNGTTSDGGVIEGPIDRVGLADNLYALREYALALEMYEQANTPATTQEEQFWIEYQRANALRHLGRLDDSRSAFRRLATAPDAGWLNEMSRWWLDRIDERVKLEKELAGYSSIIRKFEAEVPHDPAVVSP